MAKKAEKFSFLNELHVRFAKIAEVNRKGEIKMKRGDLKKAIEDAFQKGVIAAVGGQRVKFPVIGTLVRRDVKARKAGKGVNPFTGEAMTIKARPESKKPRWSFPKHVKETFANKKYW